MKFRSSSVLAAMRLAILLFAASILPATAQTDIAATAATKVVKIAVGPLSDPNGWTDFQNYINGRLPDACKIKLVTCDPESALFDLMHADTSHAIQGAMLPPFRYVVAELWIPNLTLVARMRRVGVIESNHWERYQPLNSYHSVVVMGKDANVRWPPDTNSPPVSVSISDYRSTSEFIFPFAHFSDAGLLSKVHANPRSSSVKLEKLEEAWQIPAESPAPEAVATYERHIHEDYEKHLKQIIELKASDSVISLGDHRLNWLFPPNTPDGPKFRELYRSPDIPFDALVIRGDAVSVPEMEAIRRAFLSTRDMLDQERNRCFKWRAQSSGADVEFWRRQPDIHDFVEAQDEDYDVVRAAAAKAFSGCVVHIAMSRRVHRDPKDLSYFRNLMKEVLRQTVQSRPVYIDVQLRESDFNVLLDELESGTVDAAELNAASAARSIGRKRVALIGKAIFDKKDYYHFVMLAADSETNPMRIHRLQDPQFAYTEKNSSSGYLYPFARLREDGLNPAERLRIEGRDADGVVTLLENKIEKRYPFADYGFLADFEWDNIQKQYSGHHLTKIKPVELAEEVRAIPNAYLVFSRVRAPGVNELGASSLTPEPKTPRGSSATPQPEAPFLRSSASPVLDPSVVARVKANLHPDNVDSGFGGYEPVPPKDLGELQKFYDVYGNNPFRAGRLMLITLVAFLGVGLGFSFKRRGLAAQTELSIQSLFDVLKGVSPEDRNAQNAVTLAVKQISVLRNATDLSTETLRRDLESSLLGLLTLHKPKRGTVEDGRYFAALSKLQKTTATTDEQLRAIRKSSVVGPTTPAPNGR